MVLTEKLFLREKEAVLLVLRVHFATILTYPYPAPPATVKQQVPLVILRRMAFGGHKVITHGKKDSHYPKTVLSGQQFECHPASLWSTVVFI